ncbi:30S ribosomal protein S1 [Nitzschia inconspicua]|uniref:30S ribosomal protein S1 n=1 Tax=Nitzschia inconspicua TaxID=303405 RepID=A0A9K3LBQ0_9STRA|nr:30S ribosomal protein S1 [Nitzschia inconspicua]KAG7359510.1 30S ribosomal protein S1 [Nitzschia inconspicua]
MKLSRATLLIAITASTTNAWTTHNHGPSRTRTFPLKSSTLEAPTATSASTSDSDSSAPSKRILTRFDRLKKSYKGLRNDVASDDLPFSYQDFEAAVAETSYSFERNAIVKGVCIEYDNGGCIVDIGAKASAFLPESEAALIQPMGTEIDDLVDLDKEMEFQIISEEDENGQLIVSLRRIQYREAWDAILEMQEKDEVMEAEVVSVNRGGAICLVQGLRAFLPGSHLAGQLATDDLIGQKLPLKFLEVNQENNKLVVSNRKAVVEAQMQDLSRGDLVTGIVRALKPYGAFVEVGGMSGLLHISQISYDRIDDLEKVLQPGMQVKCMIIDHDKVNGRIALSTKSLEPNPGDMLKNPQMVFEMAEESAAKYHAKMEEERKAREEAARDIVLGLGDSLDGLGDDLNGEEDSSSSSSDPLADVSDSLDSLLS